MASRKWDLVNTWKCVLLILLIHQEKPTSVQSTVAGLQKNLVSLDTIDVPPKQPTTVYATLPYLSLVDLKTATQTMVFSGFFFFSWEDARLSWEPSTYHVNYISTQKTWKPVFYIVNALAGKNWIWQEDNLFVNIKPSGDSHLGVPIFSECSCEVDVLFFPFDEQFCGIEIIGWPFESVSVVFSDLHKVKYAQVSNLLNYKGNEEWELLDFETRNTSIKACCEGSTVSTLSFVFKFKRRSGFYTVNFIMPAVAMSLLVVCTFYFPLETGERIGYSLTIMLAYTVLLTLFSSLLPSAWTKTPYIATYLLCIMLICALGTSLTVITDHLYHKQEPVPAWIKRLCRFIATLAREVPATIDGQSYAEISWKDATAKFNSLCFKFFLVLVIFINIVFFLLITQGNG